MGLDFAGWKDSAWDDCPHWSYSGFMRFRERLADAIGLKLENTMIGFGGEQPWPDTKDPLLWLLDHSDCDGDLSPAQCRKLAPRLREIVSSWPNDDYDRVQAELLSRAMELCAEQKRKLIFC